MSITLECPKCRGTMERGFILDNTHGGKVVSQWVAGEPEESFWVGGVKTKNRTLLSVTTYRCTACGYLESYAK